MTGEPRSAAPEQQQRGFDAGGTFRSVALNLLVNALLPYLAYRLLEPRFPDGSVAPLLISTVFPLLGLGFGILRKRAVDYVAVIVLVEIGITILVSLLAANVERALVARALQGTLTGCFFLATIAVGRPIMYAISRQFVSAQSPEVMAGFERGHALDGGRTFRLITAVWGVGTILVSFVNIALALCVQPANYLLVSPIVATAVNVVLIGWTIRYASTRLRPGHGP